MSRSPGSAVLPKRICNSRAADDRLVDPPTVMRQDRYCVPPQAALFLRRHRRTIKVASLSRASRRTTLPVGSRNSARTMHGGWPFPRGEEPPVQRDPVQGQRVSGNVLRNSPSSVGGRRAEFIRPPQPHRIPQRIIPDVADPPGAPGISDDVTRRLPKVFVVTQGVVVICPLPDRSAAAEGAIDGPR